MIRGSLIPAFLFAFALTTLGCSDDTEPPADMGPDVITDGPIFPDGSPDAGDGPVPDTAITDRGILPDADSCQLSIFRINGQVAPTEISILDDQDSNTAGIQLEITVAPGNAADGKEITLKVTGVTPDPTATISNGAATFTGITIDDTKSATIEISATATDCTAAPSVFLTVVPTPTCNFTAPGEGATLASINDTVPGNGQFNQNIRLETTNAVGGQVEAKYVGGASLGPLPVPPNGKVVYVNQALAITQGAKTTLEFEATVEVTMPGGGKITRACTSTDKTSPKLTFSVDTEAPSCVASIPNLQTITNGFGLGPAQNAAPTGQPGYWIEINVTTTNGEQISVSPVLERVGGTGQFSPPSQTVSNGQATFLVQLPDGDGIYNVQVDCESIATNNLGQSSISKFTLDTVKPDAPAGVSCTVDTSVSNHRKGILTCTWPQPNDPGAAASGVEEYDIRCAKNADVVPADFDTSTDYIKIDNQKAFPAPSDQEIEVTGLSIPNAYSCAVRARDVLGNESDVSNVTAQVKFEFQQQVILGEQQKDNFGAPVAAGDFNCDGNADVAVGLVTTNTNQGEVRLFFGSGSGLPAVASKRISGTEQVPGQPAVFGNIVVALDYNGDGCTDLAVRASGRNGRVFLYLGRPVWTSDRTDYGTGKGAELIIEPPTTPDAVTLGQTALAKTDFDGDGKDDLAIGYRNTTSNQAQVVLFYGTTLPLVTTGVVPTVKTATTDADVVISGATAVSDFAKPVESGGTIKTGTFGSVLVGAPKEPLTGGGTGAVYVIYGANRTTGQETLNVGSSPRVVRIAGKTSSVSFGWTLASPGDIDGTGGSDLVVTDPFHVNAGANTGEVYLFNLSTPPASAGQAYATITNDLTGDTQAFFGARIHAGSGDLTGDMKPDLVTNGIGSGAGNAAVFIFDGSTISTAKPSAPFLKFSPTDTTAFSYSAAMTLIGDVNKDGFLDLAVGDPQYSKLTGRLIITY